ncbi:MAG: guanylate kinase [Candidatus Neomarinimicrobiota bacterium]
MKNLFIITAPSGSGKSTLCKEILKRENKIQLSVSHTSRKMRPDEKNGVDYFFVTKEEFLYGIENDDYIEWDFHFDCYYGTSKSQIEQSIDNKTPLLLELDVKGAVSIQKLFPNMTTSIFVEPPNLNELIQRLEKRGSDTQEEIEKRLQRIELELSYKSNFDFSIVNDKLEDATNKIIEIIQNEIKGVLNVT